MFSVSDVVVIKTFANRSEAALAKSVLESNGIQAFVSADDAGGMGPETGFTTGGAKLFVLQDDVDAALALLGDAGILPGETPR